LSKPHQQKWFYVRTAHGSKTTQLGGSSPESLVGILAWELANECTE
jgi:hypothetical protein